MYTRIEEIVRGNISAFYPQHKDRLFMMWKPFYFQTDDERAVPAEFETLEGARQYLIEKKLTIVTVRHHDDTSPDRTDEI
jgi:hypothetical protein